MKKIICVFVIIAGICFGAGKFKLNDFSIRLEQITSAPNHIWVNSGWTTVNPKALSVMGVNDFYSPPLGTKEFNLSISIWADSFTIVDGPDFGKGDVGLLYSGGTWYPDKIVRTGTYHHLKGDKLYSFAVHSELIPLFGTSGFMEKIILTNRSGRDVRITFKSTVQPGQLINEPLAKWGFSIYRWKATPSTQEGNKWQNDKAKISLYEENKSSLLKAGQSTTYYAGIVAANIKDELPGSIDFKAQQKLTLSAWEKRLEKYTQNIPALDSDIPGLKDFYYKGIISALICIWENEKYLLNPHIATAGMDGGATCCYLWDIAGYAPKTAALMFDQHIKSIAKQMVNIDLEKFYAYTLDGNGIGVKYSYSPFAFTYLVSSIFQILGPDKDLFMAVKKLIMNDEARENPETFLIDYGEQHNLLEMRSAGYEHIVVSPNAERVWSLKQLSEMGVKLGEPPKEIQSWLVKADRIKTSIQNILWDKNKKWFASIYPNGFKDYVYSIQVYDALQSGVCTAEMENELLKHLSEGAYLGKYGVSSISAEDSLHYEVIDTDWSGGGAYSGDGPQLALCMYERNHKELGWDILKRYFWMGDHFAYFPQEIYSDKPESPAHKRANIFGGTSAVEAILFGTIGFQTDYSGGLFINPQPPDKNNISLKGFGFKGNKIDVHLSSTNMRISKNGKVIYEGTQKKIKII